MILLAIVSYSRPDIDNVFWIFEVFTLSFIALKSYKFSISYYKNIFQI